MDEARLRRIRSGSLLLGIAILCDSTTALPAVASPVQETEQWREQDRERLSRDLERAARRLSEAAAHQRRWALSHRDEARREAAEIRSDVRRAGREMRDRMRRLRTEIRDAVREMRRSLRNQHWHGRGWI